MEPNETDIYLSEDSFGQILRIPCKFIQGQSEMSPVAVNLIAKELRTKEKNVLPVIIKPIEEDEYEALINTHILDAARQANYDFVWCIVVDDAMQKQLEIETAQSLQIDINTATADEIIDMLKYIKSQRKDFSRVNFDKAVKAILDYRDTQKIKSLSFLTKQKCGIGKAKLKPLANFFAVG